MLNWITNAKVRVLESPKPELIGKFASLFDSEYIRMYNTKDVHHLDSEEWHIEICSCTGQFINTASRLMSRKNHSK